MVMKMKVVFCIPSLHNQGGMERVLTLKANYLAEIFGYEVFIVLTDGKDKKPFYDLSSKIIIINLDINYDKIYKSPLLLRIYFYILKQHSFKRKLKKILLEIRPDITISLLRREINFITSIRDGSIKIGEIHFSKVNYRNFKKEKILDGIKKIAAKFWMRQLISKLKKLDCFVVLSKEDKDNWAAELDNIIVIHNPLSFYPDIESAHSNRQVIAVGRYVHEKGFDLLIDAWSIVSVRHPDWFLSIYGNGRTDDLSAQVHSLKLENSCFLEQSVPNIVDKYLESSIFVLSSRYEGFGMVIIEAMACGLPVISYDCPEGPSEIINDGVDGFLVPLNDINELSKKISILIEDQNLRKAMGKRAKQNVRRYSKDNIMEEWRKLFNSLLSH